MMAIWLLVRDSVRRRRLQPQLGAPVVNAARWAACPVALAAGVAAAAVLAVSLVLGIAALIAAGNLLAAVPALVAARIPAAVTLRAE